MKPMNETHLAILRLHMVEVIAIQTDLVSDELGKGAVDERVLAAMRRVPRQSLCLYRLPLTPMQTGRFRSVSIKRSRSLSSPRS